MIATWLCACCGTASRRSTPHPCRDLACPGRDIPPLERSERTRNTPADRLVAFAMVRELRRQMGVVQ